MYLRVKCYALAFVAFCVLITLKHSLLTSTTRQNSTADRVQLLSSESSLSKLQKLERKSSPYILNCQW